MSQPKTRQPLLVLMFGLVLGALLGAGATQILSAPSGSTTSAARAAPLPKATGVSGFSADLDPAATLEATLLARIAELEDLIEEPRGQARKLVPPPSGNAAPATDTVQSEITQKLHDLVDRGILNGAASNENRAIAWHATAALMEEGRFADALEVGLLLGSDSAYMLQRIGMDAMEAGEDVIATAAFESALRLDVLNVKALEGLIEKDPSTAVEVFQESLAWQAPPGNPLVLRNLARALGAKGDTDGARVVIASLQEQGFDESEVAKAWKEVDPQEYERVLREELERDPAGWGRKQLAALLSERGDDEEAAELYRGMLLDEPGDVSIFKKLFETNPLDAEGLMRGYLALNSGQAWKHEELGLKLAESGRQADGIDLLLQVLPKRPWGKGYDYLLEHAPERAVQTLEAQLDKTNARSVGIYANALWQTGKTEQAVELWNEAWKLEPYDEEWYWRLNAAAAGRDPFE